MIDNFYTFIARMNYTFPDCSCTFKQESFFNNQQIYQLMIAFDDKEGNLQSWHHTFFDSDYNQIKDKESYFEKLFESFEVVYDDAMEG